MEIRFSQVSVLLAISSLMQTVFLFVQDMCSPHGSVLLFQGRLMGKADAYFSSFRRCNYPRVTAQGLIEVVHECGRYSRYSSRRVERTVYRVYIMCGTHYLIYIRSIKDGQKQVAPLIVFRGCGLLEKLERNFP